MSKTPRTDAAEQQQRSEYESMREAGYPPFSLVADFDFARLIESELAAAQKLLDADIDAGRKAWKWRCKEQP